MHVSVSPAAPRLGGTTEPSRRTAASRPPRPCETARSSPSTAPRRGRPRQQPRPRPPRPPARRPTVVRRSVRACALARAWPRHPLAEPRAVPWPRTESDRPAGPCRAATGRPDSGPGPRPASLTRPVPGAQRAGPRLARPGARRGRRDARTSARPPESTPPAATTSSPRRASSMSRMSVATTDRDGCRRLGSRAPAAVLAASAGMAAPRSTHRQLPRCHASVGARTRLSEHLVVRAAAEATSAARRGRWASSNVPAAPQQPRALWPVEGACASLDGGARRRSPSACSTSARPSASPTPGRRSQIGRRCSRSARSSSRQPCPTSTIPGRRSAAASPERRRPTRSASQGHGGATPVLDRCGVSRRVPRPATVSRTRSQCSAPRAPVEPRAAVLRGYAMRHVELLPRSPARLPVARRPRPARRSDPSRRAARERAGGSRRLARQ